MKSKAVQWLLRIVVVAVIGWYLFHSLDWGDFAKLVSASDPRWLMAAGVAYGVVTILGITRWHLLLHVAQAGVSYGRALQLGMIGLFANAFLPGMMTGDLVKVFYVARESPGKKTVVVISVITDRLLGFVAMFLVSTTLIINRYDALTSEPATKWAVYIYFAIFSLVLVSLTLGASKRVAQAMPFRDRFPWKKQLAEAGEAYRFFVRHPVAFGGGLMLSICAHFSLMLTFYFVSQALRMNLSFWDLAAVMPLVGLVSMIPATPGGIGIGEVAFKHFLLFAGMKPEASVALSLGGRLVVLVWNLLGGLVYLQFRTKHSEPAQPDSSGESLANR